MYRELEQLFAEIKDVIAERLNYSEIERQSDKIKDELHREAQDCVDRWNVEPALKMSPPEPSDKLEALLREYHALGEMIVDLNDPDMVRMSDDDDSANYFGEV